MIRVLIKYEENLFDSIEIKGHADMARSGKDIVCAGASGVVYGCLNNLKNPEALKITIDDGYVFVRKIGKVSQHDEIVFETLVCGLKTIQETYPNFISIKNL